MKVVRSLPLVVVLFLLTLGQANACGGVGDPGSGDNRCGPLYGYCTDPVYPYCSSSNWCGNTLAHQTPGGQCDYNYPGECGGYCTPPPQSAGAGGDPHFTTWNGQRYDFHGHCDLVLLKSSNFGQGDEQQPQDQGIAIHIRSAPYKAIFSYISHIAIQIGDGILEITNNGKHYVNGVLQQVGSTQAVGGFKVRSVRTENGRYIYRVFLGHNRAKQYHGQQLEIREYKDWITIVIHSANPKDFAESIGLMGSFPQGMWVGRDGITVHQDVNVFGSDWIVQSDVDGHLFRDPAEFPDKCQMPSLDDTKRRRLSEGAITIDQATEACSQWVSSSQALEDCIMDVILAEDLEMAAMEQE